MYSVKRPSLYSKTILSIPACDLEVGLGTAAGSSSGVGWSVKFVSWTEEGGVSFVGVGELAGDSDVLPNNNQSVE